MFARAASRFGMNRRYWGKTNSNSLDNKIIKINGVLGGVGLVGGTMYGMNEWSKAVSRNYHQTPYMMEYFLYYSIGGLMTGWFWYVSIPTAVVYRSLFYVAESQTKRIYK